MYQNRRLACVFASMALIASGCTTTGAGSDSLSNTVYATHRLVQDMNQNLSGTVSRLNDTTAELVSRLDTSDQEVRQLMSLAEENQYKLGQLQQSLDSLTATLYRHFNLSPPEPMRLPAPTRPLPGPATGLDRGTIIVEPPVTAPAQPDTSVEPPPLPPRSSQTPQAVTPAPGPSDTVDEITHYRQAQTLYGNDEFAAALAKFTEYLEVFPNSANADNATYWKAHCYFKMGEYQEAIAGFDGLLNSYPSSAKVPIAIHNQAVAYSRLGQNERAIELFQRLIREHPDDIATEGARDKLRQLQNLN